MQLWWISDYLCFYLHILATSEEKKILEKNDGKQMEREVAAKRVRGKEYI